MVDIQRQPVVFLGEGAQRVVGRDAQRLNILVARAVANVVRTTLGPKGMDKMLVDELGDITITNDGATILQEMSIEHPAGKIMVEVAKAQDEEAGDGTTTATVLAGELLGNAERLLDQEIHPSIIIKGYRMAAEKAVELLDEIGDKVDINDDEILKKIAMTSMTSKITDSREKLAQMVVDAIKMVAEEYDGKIVIDIDQIKIEKKQGGSMEDTQLIKGIVIDKERVHPQMPRRVENAKIALINSALEVKETETDAKIQITSPDQLQAFIEQEEMMLKEMVEKIKEAGANVVFVQKGIDDLAQHYLAKAGILAVRRVKKSDMEKLARATGAKIVTRVEDLSPEDLGEAELVEERKISGESMIFVEGCKNPKAVTILVRGGAEHVVDEAERALRDAIGAVASAIESGKVVAGGGAPEMELAIRLREYAQTVGGKEQLAIEAFADALEIIPRTLAETAGMDPIDTVVRLRSKHAKEKDGKYWGVDVFAADIANMKEKNVLEPVKVKKQAIMSASEAARLILKIDDIIAATKKSKEGEESESETEFD
ncbi:MAG: archaeal chaperonin [Candidatus Diapherotrites archaeon]|nr:archaeal chaperonin [Candidatus Diapherotrites archaeon]MDN5367116.1 archaeal chaperonin [Candidatus Diapherotrites archaeon]